MWGSLWKWELTPVDWGFYLSCLLRVTDNLLCLTSHIYFFPSEEFVSCLLSLEYLYFNIFCLCSCFTFSVPFPNLVCAFWAWSSNHNSLQTGQRQTCLLCTRGKSSNFLLLLVLHVLVYFYLLVSLRSLQLHGDQSSFVL